MRTGRSVPSAASTKGRRVVAASIPNLPGIQISTYRRRPPGRAVAPVAAGGASGVWGWGVCHVDRRDADTGARDDGQRRFTPRVRLPVHGERGDPHVVARDRVDPALDALA